LIEIAGSGVVAHGPARLSACCKVQPLADAGHSSTTCPPALEIPSAGKASCRVITSCGAKFVISIEANSTLSHGSSVSLSGFRTSP
jgi:hypothetical protein